MNPLPKIIMEIPKVLVENYEAKMDLEIKKIVLCITRDISSDEQSLFDEYKLVRYNDDVHRNISISQFVWDILIIDLREKRDRYFFMTEIQQFISKYKIIAYIHPFQVDEFEFDCDNILTSFPLRQARKEDFEMLLLLKRISKPRWYKDLFNCVLNFVSRTKN